MELYNDDCFNVFPTIKEKSINLFLLDLPYANKKFGNCTACAWDTPIDLEKMWVEIKRTMKPNGIIVFFCNTKFGYALINSNPKWFKYDLIWEKSKKVGFLSANKMPLRKHENIYVFKNEQGTYNPQKVEGKPYIDKRNHKINNYYREDGKPYEYTAQDNKGLYHPSSVLPEFKETHENIYIFKKEQGTYNPQKTEGKPYTATRKDCDLYSENIEHQPTINKGDRHPTSIIDNFEETHENIYIFKKEQGTYNPQKTAGHKPRDRSQDTQRDDEIVYGKIKNGNNTTDERHPSTILKYNSVHKTIHKTQKPVDLLEWLIKTYTNEEDTVMDFCMGSGSCGMACKNTNRKFIGIEKDKDIFELAEKRLKSN